MNIQLPRENWCRILLLELIRKINCCQVSPKYCCEKLSRENCCKNLLQNTEEKMLVNKEKPKKTTTSGSIPITNTNNYYIRLTKENLNITATARLTKRSCLDPSSHDNIYLNKYI